MFLPPRDPALRWAAVRLTNVDVGFHIWNSTMLYYEADATGFHLPVHAEQFAIDWGGTAAALNYTSFIPLLRPCVLYHINLWDGSTQHTFPSYTFGHGGWPLASMPEFIGVNVTKCHQPRTLVMQKGAFGRAHFRPIPKIAISGNYLTPAFHSDFVNLAKSLYIDDFLSELNTWKPRLFQLSQNSLRLIQNVHVPPRICQFRKGLRDARFDASIPLPPAFPTPTG